MSKHRSEDLAAALGAVDSRVSAALRAERIPADVEPSYLREAVEAYPGRGGKRLRPALVYWFCGLVGGDTARALRAAVAVELYHNWTLVHDDIIDGDEVRRGAPSCHRLVEAVAGPMLAREPADRARYCEHMAMLAGDIQQSWAVNALCRAVEDGVSVAVVHSLVRRLTGWVTPLLVSGEALDVEFAQRTDVGAEEIERMLVLKTGILLRFAAETGVMLGTGTDRLDDPRVVAAGAFAEDAGLAFQIKDDLLGVFGDEAALGKPVGADLREGKRTLLLVTALQRLRGEEREEMLALWGQTSAGPTEISRARELLTGSGAVAVVESRARELTAGARERLGQYPENRYRHLLGELLEFIVERGR